MWFCQSADLLAACFFLPHAGPFLLVSVCLINITVLVSIPSSHLIISVVNIDCDGVVFLTVRYRPRLEVSGQGLGAAVEQRSKMTGNSDLSVVLC